MEWVLGMAFKLHTPCNKFGTRPEVAEGLH